MKADRWLHVREILAEALGLPVNERSSYLRKVCGTDSDLRSEVESLLRANEDAGSVFLKTPAVNLKQAEAERATTAGRVGRTIGVYEIVGEVGRGGMGEVYRAVRADGQYKKVIAIKLVRSGYDTSLMLGRFLHERQILASLDHPNIARLHDGGTTDEGVPYLVMELIEGLPIDQYCDQHEADISSRLRLFMQVCAAVQYAHQRLVIHRDIKPSNILVTTDGTPKLLDFGIAKILDASGGAELTLLHPMTPEYSSPEQIRGEPISTSSDVYSLGVILYKLLTGRSPYGEAKHTPLELVRVICESEPPRPSTVVRQIAPERGSNMVHVAHNLQRRLKGDLDNIVLKALRKEPRERYSSVEQLAEDIRRHLNALPVKAVKPSLRYRASKFARRNRVAVAAATLVCVTLISGVAATIRQARIARKQAAIASEERTRAERRFQDVRELANSLIFEIHDSIQGLPGATPSRKLLLDRAVEYLDKLSQDSAGDINLQRDLAWAYYRLAKVQGDTRQSNLGQVKAAELSNRKSMALFEAVAKANPNNLTDQLNLAMAYRWRAFLDIYEPQGLAEIERALAVTEPLMRSSANNLDLENERAQEFSILAEIQDEAGNRLQAIDSFRKVLDLQRKIFQANPAYADIRRGIAKTTVLLGHQVGHFGSQEEGIALLNTGIAEFEALVKDSGGDPGLVREKNAAEGRRADIQLMHGDVSAARASIERSLKPLRSLAKLDPENKMLQADVWAAEFQDGRALAFAGRYREALPQLERALQGYKSLHLEADVWPGPAAMETWIGEAQAGTRQYEQALKSFEAAALKLAEDEPDYDDARCDLAMVETKIGTALLDMGKWRDAESHYRKALQTAKLATSIQRSDFPSMYAAAEAYAGLGDLSAAEARSAGHAPNQAKLWEASCAAYKDSFNVWKQIPFRSRLSGNGYMARSPQTVSQHVEACQRDISQP